MTDIVKRLRDRPLDMNPHLKEEAAKEIERLRDELNIARGMTDSYREAWQKQFRT